MLAGTKSTLTVFLTVTDNSLSFSSDRAAGLINPLLLTPMPSLKSTRKATTPTQQPPPRPDNQLERLSLLGAAVALADLAEAKGMTVDGVSSFPTLLTEAGLPEKIGPTLGHAAHRIYRDRIDAMLFRCNRPINQSAPVLSRPEAEAAIVKVEKAIAVTKATERVKAVEASQPKKDRPIVTTVVAEAEVIEF